MRIVDPLGYRTTLHWCIQWTCGHTETSVADKTPSACSVCGCRTFTDIASYPIRVQA